MQDPTLKAIKNESSVNDNNRNESLSLDLREMFALREAWPGDRKQGIKMKASLRGNTEPHWLTGPQSQAEAWGALLQVQKGPGAATLEGLALKVTAMHPEALGDTERGRTPLPSKN